MLSSSKAIENIIEKIVGEVSEEAKANLEDGLKRSLEILEVAKRETMVEAERTYESAKRQAETVRLRMLSRVELATMNKSLKFIEEMMNEIFQRAYDELKKITSSDRYKALIKRFLEEGVDAVESKNLVVMSNKKDSEILKVVAEGVAKERKVKIKVAEEAIESIGGVQVRSSDGLIFYDNTIEARFERFKPLLRKNIALLFMGKEG